MEARVRESRFVLLICTPLYKRKFDDRLGGVGYEARNITGEILAGLANRKVIPIYRRGDTWAEAAPSIALGSFYVNLTGTLYPEAAYRTLVDTLRGRREVAPPLGRGLDGPGAALAVPQESASVARTGPSKIVQKNARALLKERLRTDGELDLFCQEHFPRAFDRFTDGMTRDRKTVLLFTFGTAEEVLSALGEETDIHAGTPMGPTTAPGTPVNTPARATPSPAVDPSKDPIDPPGAPAHGQQIAITITNTNTNNSADERTVKPKSKAKKEKSILLETLEKEAIGKAVKPVAGAALTGIAVLAIAWIHRYLPTSEKAPSPSDAQADPVAPLGQVPAGPSALSGEGSAPSPPPGGSSLSASTRSTARAIVSRTTGTERAADVAVGTKSPNQAQIVSPATEGDSPSPSKCAASCAGEGRCHAVNGQCVAEGDDDCRPSKICESNHRCAEAEGRCVPCKDAPECALDGRCTDDGRQCLARTDADCEASRACASGARCSAASGTCWTASNKDCTRSELCRENGLCVFANGACQAVADSDCVDKPICTKEHRCAARGGRCVPN
jgi:hypothetical protein